MKNLRVALLGPPIDHRQSLEAQLVGHVSDVSWLPDSYTFLRERPRSRIASLPRHLDALWGTRDRTYLDETIAALDEREIDVVIAYWGTMPLPDVQSIKRARPGLRMALLALCYPLALSAPGIWRQRLSLMRAVRFLDGVICPTEEMADYLRSNVLARSRVALGVVPPCWPAGLQASSRAPAVSDRPNLVYVGRTDLSSRTIHAADDVRPMMDGLLAAGIELHHGYSRETADGHALRRPFDPVPMPQLIARMGGFDASLVAYNREACTRTDRFRLTVADRLITSVAAGVPVALPRQGYAASRTYLADYPALIEFGTPAELYDALSDRNHVDQLRAAAWKAREGYTAEAQSGRLLAFLEELVARDASRG